jgi:hypothetical protein
LDTEATAISSACSTSPICNGGVGGVGALGTQASADVAGATAVSNINANAGIGDLAAETRPENVNTWYIIKY